MANKYKVLEEGDVVLARAQVRGLKFLPCLPARQGDELLEAQDGLMLSVVALKELSPGQLYYVMEVITGNFAGDLVYIGTGLTPYVEKIPTKRRIR